MIFETACEKCNIDKTDLQYFADKGVVPCGELDDNQTRSLGLIVLLLKAGLEKQDIVRYFQCAESKDGKYDRAKILKKLRGNLLDEIHDKQKQLDKIDYLIHDLELCIKGD